MENVDIWWDESTQQYYYWDEEVQSYVAIQEDDLKKMNETPEVAGPETSPLEDGVGATEEAPEDGVNEPEALLQPDADGNIVDLHNVEASSSSISSTTTMEPSTTVVAPQISVRMNKRASTILPGMERMGPRRSTYHSGLQNIALAITGEVTSNMVPSTKTPELDVGLVQSARAEKGVSGNLMRLTRHLTSNNEKPLQEQLLQLAALRQAAGLDIENDDDVRERSRTARAQETARTAIHRQKSESQTMQEREGDQRSNAFPERSAARRSTRFSTEQFADGQLAALLEKRVR